MLQKTKGIVISYIKYRESSIIAKVYTEKFGIQSYVVNSVRSKNAKTRIALFQPLTLLDLVVYFNKNRDIHRISELKCSYTFQSIPFDIRKTSIVLFLTEFLNKTLREEGENISLFEFLRGSIITLDESKNEFENFHLHFLLKLTFFFGILPISGTSMLEEVGSSLQHDEQALSSLKIFLNKSYEENVKLNKTKRNALLKNILDFYRFHFDGLGEIKSLSVLKEVLN